MGLLFSKNSHTIVEQENTCSICNKKLETTSYIVCKSTNSQFHLECLTDETDHLENCEECRKMHLYMNLITNLLHKDDFA